MKPLKPNDIRVEQPHFEKTRGNVLSLAAIVDHKYGFTSNGHALGYAKTFHFIATNRIDGAAAVRNEDSIAPLCG